MKGHVHDSALFGATVFAFVLLYGLAWRETTHRLTASDGDKRNAFGQAMAYLY